MNTRNIVAGGIVLAAAVLVAVGPDQIASLPTLCIFRSTLGWECPGCGMLRALCSLAEGDLHRAVSYNWKVVIVGPLLAYLAIREIVSVAVSPSGEQTDHDVLHRE